MANTNQTDRARRDVVAGIGIAAVAALAGNSAVYASVETTIEETDNLAIASAFCRDWSNKHVDIESMVKTRFTEDCIVRVLDSTMVAHGQHATIGMFAGWLESGRSFELKILRSTALGPIVVQIRKDTISKGGKNGKSDATAAVFVMSNGKIRELSDYFIS